MKLYAALAAAGAVMAVIFWTTLVVASRGTPPAPAPWSSVGFGVGEAVQKVAKGLR